MLSSPIGVIAARPALALISARLQQEFAISEMEFGVQFALHKSSTAHVAEGSGSALLAASWEVLLASRNDISADLIDRQRSANKRTSRFLSCPTKNLEALSTDNPGHNCARIAG
jgi:hypothetical protein